MISRVFQKTGTGIGTTASSGATTAAGGGKKTRSGGIMSGLYNYNSNNDVCSSPSSVSISVSQQLPPLLESSPYGVVNEACSYVDDGGEANNNNSIKKEHVSCFSISSNTNNNNNTNTNINNISNFNPFELNFQPSPPQLPPTTMMCPTTPRSNAFSMVGGGGLPMFPSLRSLQDNLHLPWVGGGGAIHGGSSGGCELDVMMASGNNNTWGGGGFDHNHHGIGGNGGGGKMGLGGGSELDCMWSY